jgi:hypothetical protein
VIMCRKPQRRVVALGSAFSASVRDMQEGSKWHCDWKMYGAWNPRKHSFRATGVGGVLPPRDSTDGMLRIQDPSRRSGAYGSADEAPPDLSPDSGRTRHLVGYNNNFNRYHCSSRFETQSVTGTRGIQLQAHRETLPTVIFFVYEDRGRWNLGWKMSFHSLPQ